MTLDPAPSSAPGLVVCVGLPADQIIEIAHLLRGRATVLATPDAEGARAVLDNQTTPRRAGSGAWRGAGARTERYENPGPAGDQSYGRHLHALPGDRLAESDNLTETAARPAAEPVLYATIPVSRSAPGPAPAATEGTQASSSPHRAETGAVPAVSGSIPMVAPPTVEPLVAGPLFVDLAGREVTALGRRVYLSAREFDLLATLALEAGRVWSFAELTARVWQLPYLGDSDPVTSAVKRLRKRLAPVRDVEVASVRGVGYRLRVWG